MATNDFKPFATGSGANVLSQADYEALSALASGFLSGKASSAQVNKALRQSSTIAAVLAQFMADSTGSDVLDNGNIATLLNILKSALNNQAEGRLLRIQVFTASGAWVKTAGTKKSESRHGVQAGWEGNGHSRDGASSGAGGAYVEGLYDVSSITGANIVIGAGGAAVVAGNSGNGGDGGDTTIVDLGISAGGGKGGNSTGNSAGGTPGAPSVGTIFSVVGQGGQGAVGALGGVGGASHSSYGGLPHVSTSGDDGFFPGGGGAGASYDSVARASGKGANGYVIIEELA
ncbi:hypothetical protein BANRA_02676 [Klebsiella pneumoniae]|nr:hypothetical protein BANRA_03803 [Klebsiella pneumoniae]VCX50395.1 hypothetical protein BANRA_02676 [Klebsiella pneumoniae]